MAKPGAFLWHCRPGDATNFSGLCPAKNGSEAGGNPQRITLDEERLDLNRHARELLELNDLIEEMAKFDKRKSKVVEMRFFAGMTIREIAELLEVSTRTVDRDWLKARTWLHKELKSA